MKARCQARLRWQLTRTGALHDLIHLLLMTETRLFVARYFCHLAKLKQVKTSLVHFRVEATDYSQKVVNALWIGDLIQKNNDNDEIECEYNFHPYSAYAHTRSFRCSILSNS